MTRYHLATRCNILLRYERTPSDLAVVACAQLGVTFKPPEKKRGKLKILLDNMKYTTEKKVNAAYIRLMRYFMNIYRYINLFRKALQSHIIPYNSY